MDSQRQVHCHYSVAMDMIVLEVGTVALPLFQGRGVVAPMGMDNQGVVGFSGIKHKPLTEFLPVDEVPVPLLAGSNWKLR